MRSWDGRTSSSSNAGSSRPARAGTRRDSSAPRGTSDTHAELCAYTRNLLPELEAETGQSTGFRQVGSVAIAHSRDRFAELRRLADSYNAFGFGRMEVITAEEVGHFHPLVRTDDLLGGTWLEIDGMASPVDVVSAYVKGARGRGVRCIENVKVTGIRTANGNGWRGWRPRRATSRASSWCARRACGRATSAGSPG